MNPCCAYYYYYYHYYYHYYYWFEKGSFPVCHANKKY